VNQFAEATNDHQWIHVDVERAEAGPFGGTIAHGYMTLALIPFFANQLMSIQTPGAKLNYGVNKVRFPTVVPVGGRLRCRATITEATSVASGQQLVVRYTIDLEDSAKPACVAETVVLLVAG
jgi:acyl dehydratase